MWAEITRAMVVAKAREFVGSPFRHQGRTKGSGPIGGLDCVGLPLCVAEELELSDVAGAAIRGTDHLDYGPQEVQGRILEVCRARLTEKPLDTPLEPGDVIVLRVPDVPTHAAIVSELPGGKPREHILGMIHAYAGTINKVVENRIDDKWQRRIVAVFCFPGVES